MIGPIQPDPKLLASIMDNMLDALVITDETGVIVFCNPATIEKFGYSANELLGNNVRILMPDAIGASNDEFIGNCMSTGKRQLLGTGVREMQGKHKNGQILPLELSLSEARTGSRINFIGRMRDISDRVNARENLERLSQRDNLTGLPNWTSFVSRLDETLERASRAEKSVALILLGVDHFKVINDGLGHSGGDALLTRIARRLLREMKPGEFLSRLAGDEFAVLQPLFTDAAEVHSKVQQLRRAMQVPFAMPEHTPTLSVGIGVSVFPADGKNANELVKNTTAALSSAKKTGPDQVAYYRADLSAKAQRRLSMEGQLQQALKRNEFSLYYQPKIDVLTGQVRSAEALLRWERPETGAVAPAEFIPLLEETGLIKPVGEWVLAEACHANRAWQDAGLPELAVGVNISARQFQLQDLPEMIARSLRHARLGAAFLDLEITEGVLLEDMESTVVTLEAIREIGVSVSLDDFGTGYSSLSYLKRLPINTIKIDRSFINNVTTEPDSAAIVRTIIAMAHNLKLAVVAEGVETREQLGFLARHHCDEIQGYYFSKPLLEDEFRNLLEQGDRFDVRNIVGPASRRTLLIVDDEDQVRASLIRVFRRESYQILTAADADEALDLAALNDIGVIISDQRMPGMTGIELLSRIRDMYPSVVRIILSAFTELEDVMDGINRGAIYKFLTKPWDDNLLRENVRDAFRYYELLRDSNKRQTR